MHGTLHTPETGAAVQLLNIARRNWQTMGMLNVGMPHLGRLTRPEQRFLKRTFPANAVDVAHFEAARRAGSIDPRIVRIQERARAIVNPPADDPAAAAADTAAGPTDAAAADAGAAVAPAAAAPPAEAVPATAHAAAATAEGTPPAAATAHVTAPAAAHVTAPAVPDAAAAVPAEAPAAAAVGPDDDLEAESKALRARLHYFFTANRLYPWARSRHYGRFRQSKPGDGIKDGTCIIAPAMLNFIEEVVVRCMAGFWSDVIQDSERLLHFAMHAPFLTDLLWTSLYGVNHTMH